MGHVIRAFRLHPLHGCDVISQRTVAEWVGLTQAQLSRIETGAPIVHLNRLIQWACLLRIPEAYLWFELPESPQGGAQSRFAWSEAVFEPRGRSDAMG